jgi:hypothetical protein
VLPPPVNLNNEDIAVLRNKAKKWFDINSLIFNSCETKPKCLSLEPIAQSGGWAEFTAEIAHLMNLFHLYIGLPETLEGCNGQEKWFAS